MFNNPNIFNPSITYNNRVYFNTPTGGKFEHKIYNPNNQSTRLPYNYGQQYNEGTPKYYQNLQGLNSSVFKHDNIIGKTVYTESGRPIVLQEKHNVKIPQVKYDYDIPVMAGWSQMDYCDVDKEAVNKNIRSFMENEFNLPLNSDVKTSYQATNPTDLPVITDQTINHEYNKEYDLKPREMTFGNIMDIINNRNKQYSNSKFNQTDFNIKSQSNSIKNPKDNLEYFINDAESKRNEYTNNKESFSTATLNDTDTLYKEMIRAYAKAISFYLNSNPKYSYWEKNWKILEKNLIKKQLLVDRLDEQDNEIAYTENKGEIIKFRWRDRENYISKNIFMYVVLHELTHQVFPMSFRGHGKPFPDMLCLLCVAGFELNLFDLSSIPRSTVYTNNQPICSRNSIYNEIMRGIEMLREKNHGSDLYYDHLTQYVNAKMKN